MYTSSRRDFLKNSAGVLAVGGSLILADDALPTEPSGDLGVYGRALQQQEQQRNRNVPLRGNRQPANWNATETNILGPYHREGAPFRAKITPPLAAGTVLLISGRVWGTDTRRPLPFAVLDVWQADANGRYDNDDPRNPPRSEVFVNRARLIADENGYYEFETIHPGPYQIGPQSWRPSHIHYWIRHPGYRELVTQLYFRGDPHQRTDQFIRDSLIINLQQQRVNNQTCKSGTFDIVLTPAQQGR